MISFHLSFPKVLYKSALLFIIKLSYKSVLLSIIKVSYKSVLLSIIIDLSYPKVLYKSVLLSSKNVALRNLTSLIVPKSVKFPLDLWNKQKIKSTQKQQTFCKTCCKLMKTSCKHKMRTIKLRQLSRV